MSERDVYVTCLVLGVRAKEGGPIVFQAKLDQEKEGQSINNSLSEEEGLKAWVVGHEPYIGKDLFNNSAGSPIVNESNYELYSSKEIYSGKVPVNIYDFF